MEGKVFDRIEKKYLITEKAKKQFLKVIKKNMKKDAYFCSKVFNLYFDNDNYDLIIQSIDQPEFKEKIRARSYEGYDRVFLEIKTKLRGKDNNVGYKRRVMITRNDFLEFLEHQKTITELAERDLENTNDPQIAKEVDYLIDHFDLKPKILVIYDRESYKDDSGLRITFDENLKYRTDFLSSFQEKNDKIYFKDGQNIIMEIKAHGVLPLWLVKTLSENRAYPQQFSKVGKIYEKIRKEKHV